MHLRAGLVKIDLMGIAIRNIPVIKGIMGGQYITCTMRMAISIALKARPAAFRVNPILSIGGPVPDCVIRHSKCQH